MKIAITQRVIDFRNGPYDSLDHGFYDMFSGHKLRPIPNNLEHYQTDIIVKSDLVVFTGGNSMVPGNWQYNENRLRVEKHTLDLAKLYNKPILGISRGCQFLNVSFGGKLRFSDRHKQDHSVYYKGSEVIVHSRHEEILSTIPVGATCLATDKEGFCESWKLDNIITVLWHPERMRTHWLPYEAYGILGL
jgi:gamma-glutamyl-gamma-aminobutyrate hydrolase PuuD